MYSYIYWTILSVLLMLNNRDGRRRNPVSISGRHKIFFVIKIKIFFPSPKVQTGSAAHPAFYAVEACCFSPGHIS
jgi:hypothetical protein